MIHLTHYWIILLGIFFVSSTPNGRRGIFFDLWHDETNEFHKIMLPYTRSLNKLLDSDYIERKKKDRSLDFPQEYECQFTTPRGSFISSELIESCCYDYQLDVI